MINQKDKKKLRALKVGLKTKFNERKSKNTTMIDLHAVNFSH